MSRIKLGDLVRFMAINGEWETLFNKTGLVVSKPKEKSFKIPLDIISIEVVVDVLVDDRVYEDVRITVLEKKPRY